MKKLVSGLIIAAIVLWCSNGFAAHPLITDDAGTQGKGKFQFELNGELSHEKIGGVKITETGLAASLTYGASDELDVVVGFPWVKGEVDDGVQKTSESGVSDVSLAAKWRFMEKDGFSLALKPGITLPTGDEKKGLGAGKPTYSLFFIATRELKPVSLHLNLGYIRNENKLDEEVGIWHASIAADYAATEKLRIVANVGTEKNREKNADTDPAFALAGVVYSVTESFDVDFGYKVGLNDAEPDQTVLAGITLRF